MKKHGFSVDFHRNGLAPFACGERLCDLNDLPSLEAVSFPSVMKQ
jgi:hypothetical protein